MEYMVMIPARFASTRFPGKPLAKICGEEMIVRVCRQVEKTGYPFAVATDSPEIYECVTAHGFTAVMTSDKHRSGTDRIMEAVDNLGVNPDVVVNVQGDEPFINPEQIKKLTSIFERHSSTEIATLVKKFNPADGIASLEDPNLVKVVFGEKDDALYFSRSVVPYIRNVDKKDWPKSHEFFTHIGIYAYRLPVLREITRLSQSPLEKAESLEQLRWLENGYKVKVGVTDFSTIGIDTPEDLRKAEEFLTKQ